MEFQKLQPKQKANNNLYAPSFSPTLPLHKPDGEAQISGGPLVADASIIVEKGDHCEDVVLDQPNSVMKKENIIPLYSLGLRLSQPDSQSPTNSVPDPSTARANKDDGREDDDNGAPSRFLLRNTSQVNRQLRIKKYAENKPKQGDESFSKKGDFRKHSVKPTTESSIGEKMIIASTIKQAVEQQKGSPRAYRKRQAPYSNKPKLTKEVLPKKDHEKPYCFPYVIWLTKLDGELSRDELLISKYIFGKVEDVDDSCSDKEATRASTATLKPGEELEMDVINIWSSILNDRERKRDLATTSGLFMLCDQRVSASHSTYYSIITA
ncbi:LOW QUALITY PROTEIN: hypothetical protein Cgig2_003106 [Carnegiea gigantea]|uniref:Uncharacterized protein n=1 Tax=Carnegiea gigantea TaxID=171969 RepID=A0A9Q1K1L9_9CARY|nr:LOW QUALITY PROTEIN: hypothetical protein Cgig2_003106 [Carnegiea gigantea]